jgi:hypothetical protein
MEFQNLIIMTIKYQYKTYREIGSVVNMVNVNMTHARSAKEGTGGYGAASRIISKR